MGIKIYSTFCPWQHRRKTKFMKTLKLFFLLFPLIAMSQKKFDIIREKLKQNNKYEYVYGFENNYAVFRTFDNKMGVIDSTENVVIRPVFSFIHNKKELKNLFEVGNKINKKFKRGFIDLKGNIKIPIIYDDVFYIGKGIIRVTKDNKFGVIDTLNNIILPIKFDYIFTNNNLLVARIKSTNKLYDFQGIQISNLEFTDISNFIENKAIITFQNKSTSIIDSLGNIVLRSIKNYSFEKVLNDDLYLIKNNLNTKEGVINSKGEFIINCKYVEINQVKSFFIAKSNGKKGFISLTDSIVKPFIYDEIYFSYIDDAVSFGDNNLQDNYIVQKDKLYGVINPNIENDIIPLGYKNISTLFNKYFIVHNTENKNGLFTDNGEKVLPEIFRFYTIDGYKIFAIKDTQPLILNIQNPEETIFLDKDIAFVKTARHHSMGEQFYQIVKKENKFGVINASNQVIVPLVYDEVKSSQHWRYFIIRDKGRIGLINVDGDIVKEPIYDAIELRKEYVLLKRKNQKDEIYSYKW